MLCQTASASAGPARHDLATSTNGRARPTPHKRLHLSLAHNNKPQEMETLSTMAPLLRASDTFCCLTWMQRSQQRAGSLVHQASNLTIREFTKAAHNSATPG